MRIVIHHKKNYDWMPVPAEVKTSGADWDSAVKSGKIKPSASGGWIMQVVREFDNFTTVGIPEAQIVAKIIHEKTRPEGGRTLTRKQAVAFLLSENVLPHHAHRSWITKFEVHDDGPDEKLMREMLAPHFVSPRAAVMACAAHEYKVGAKGAKLACANCNHVESTDPVSGAPYTIGNDPNLSDEPNIEPSEVGSHVLAYMESVDAGAHEQHLAAHFKVNSAKVVS